MAEDADYPESRATAYTTLAAGPQFRHEIEVKRSRFITVLQRTGDEDCARSVLAGLRKEFHDARHHCTAFVLGPDRGVQRSNDDGEPSGTAGIPMLEALLRRETAPGVTDLSDVTAVVVRYFGGILLGAGGLVRAYSESVSGALWTVPRWCSAAGCGSAPSPCRMRRPVGWKMTCAPRAMSWRKPPTGRRLQS